MGEDLLHGEVDHDGEIGIREGDLREFGQDQERIDILILNPLLSNVKSALNPNCQVLRLLLRWLSIRSGLLFTEKKQNKKTKKT